MQRLYFALIIFINIVLSTAFAQAQEVQDVTCWMDASTEDISGWATNHFWLNTGAGGGRYYGSDGSALEYPFLEYWDGNARLQNDKLTHTISYVPQGRYCLKAAVIAADQRHKPAYKIEGVMLKLGNNSVSLETADGKPQWFQVVSDISSGTAELGLVIKSPSSSERTAANWVAIDNISLLFYGTKAELIEAEKQKVTQEALLIYTQEDIDTRISDAIATSSDLQEQFKALEVLRKTIAKKVALRALMPKDTPLDNAFPNLRINGLGMAYDFSNNLYLFSTPEVAFSDKLTATITYDKNEGWSDLVIDGTKVESGSSYTFPKAVAEKKYTFSASKSDGTRITSSMTMTTLPIVEIYGNFGYDYDDGFIRVYEPGGKHPALLSSKKKWRGGITNQNSKHKRNYAVKLYDENGNKLDQKFFGLRKDNKWILEAAQVDMSRTRNRVLTDIWNDFAAKPYYFDKEPKALTGTRGTSVELLLNGSYNGIYHMTERVDRKQMKLMDYDTENQIQHGQLWKAKDWSYEVFMGHNSNQNSYPRNHAASFNKNSDTWQGYNYEYPDVDDVKPVDWQTLYNAVDFMCSASDEEIKSHFCEYFDFPVFMDYYIFMEILLSTDNHGKNTYFAVYDKQQDKKITLGLWDVDATLGQRWSDAYYHSDLMKPEQDYAQYITKEEHGDWNPFRKLRDCNINNFNESVRYRYRELRNGLLSPENINHRFEVAINRFIESGAAARESKRWSYDSDVEYHALDFQNELDFIKDWVTRRITYLDKTRFKIDLLPSAIETTQNTSSAYDDVWISGGSLYVHAANARDIAVRTLSGTTVQTFRLIPGTNNLGQLPSGIYIVADRKVVIR